MRKLLAVALVASVVVLAGCGSNSPGGPIYDPVIQSASNAIVCKTMNQAAAENPTTPAEVAVARKNLESALKTDIPLTRDATLRSDAAKYETALRQSTTNLSSAVVALVTKCGQLGHPIMYRISESSGSKTTEATSS